MAAKKKKTKFGIVVLLDALGTRTANIEQAEKYIETVNSLKKVTLPNIKQFLTLNDNAETIKRIYSSLKYRFFGDSLLFTIEVKNDVHFTESFQHFVTILSMMIVSALEKGILFRGALAIGNYIEDSTIVLGPAVTDAASWYEKIDLMTVIASPAATNFIKAEYSTKKNFNESKPMPLIRMADVPCSDNKEVKAYLLDWPMFICIMADVNKMDPFQAYYVIFKELPIPIGTELKYYNTEKFFKESVERFNRSSKPSAVKETKNEPT